MSTRSNIARENLDGSLDMIYCHHDGYPSHHGPILLDHYVDPTKVDDLMRLGDISSLGEMIGEKHDFDWMDKYFKSRKQNTFAAYRDDPLYKTCNAYGRDRAEADTAAKHFNLSDLQDSDRMQEYLYVFRVRDGKWYWTDTPRSALVMGPDGAIKDNLLELTTASWAEVDDEDEA